MAISKVDLLGLDNWVAAVTKEKVLQSLPIEPWLCAVADEIGSDQFIAAIRTFAEPSPESRDEQDAYGYLRALANEFAETDFEEISMPTATVLLSSAYQRIELQMRGKSTKLPTKQKRALALEREKANWLRWVHWLTSGHSFESAQEWEATLTKLIQEVVNPVVNNFGVFE